MKKNKQYYEDNKPKAYKLFEEGKNIKEIASILNIDRHIIGKYIRFKGYVYSKYNKCSINSNIFNIIDTEEKAYWLGFLYADGNISIKENRIELSLSEKDKEHLEKFKTFLSYKGNIYFKQKTKSYRILFRDSQIHKDLIKLGCIPRKSLILKFPIKKQVPKKLIFHFIRGYFDGDGYIRDSKSAIEITLLGTKEFLRSILDILKININLKKDKRHLENTYYISLCGDNARNFGIFLYKNSTIFLERKKDRFVNHLNKSII